MSRKACLIFNPVAGQGDAEQDLEQIKKLLSPEIDLDIQKTTKEVGADQLAKEAVEKDVESIIVSGGDGTISQAAKAVVESDIPLGIISRGTANAFAAALNLPDTIQEACQVILDGKTKKIDTAMCNGQPMVLLAGVGFEAETVDTTTREAKDRWGMAAYALSGFRQLSEFEAFTVKVETDEKILQSFSTGAVTVANAAPATSVLAQGPAGIVYDDGLLDVTLVALSDVKGALGASYHLLQSAFLGNSAEREDIGYLRTKWLKITADPPQKIVLDGELIGETPIEVECIPGGLTVFVPAFAQQDLSKQQKALRKLKDIEEIRIEPKASPKPII